MMGVCTRNISSEEYTNKITLLHQIGISYYFMRKMHGQTTLIFHVLSLAPNIERTFDLNVPPSPIYTCQKALVSYLHVAYDPLRPK